MGFIGNFLEFFKPNDFKDDNYGWLTNQISHSALSFVLIYYFSFIFNYKYVCVFFILFWLIWEIRHYLQTKNLTDLVEDLFFEISGILIYINVFVFLPITIIGLIIVFFLRLKDGNTNNTVL